MSTTIRLSFTAYISLCGLFLAPAAYAEDPTINRLLASQCAQCHGTDGHAVRGIVGLNDESPKDLYEDLRDMRKEDRLAGIMDHQALGYTPDQIRRIGLYYGSISGKTKETIE